MKKFLFFLLLLVSLRAFSQSTDESLKQSQQLVKEKKYNSAFKLLEKVDPKNRNADIVIAKEDILLNYFVTSIMHSFFALKDLQQNEDIMDYRGKEGKYDIYAFEADSILGDLIKRDTSNYKLYGALGNYYYDVYLHYNANWKESAETLFKYIEDDFAKVIEAKHADYMVFYELGYIELLQKKYQKATMFFQKSIELNDIYANAWYNGAYSYLYQDDRVNAIKYAVKSIDLYNDKSYKADAARMAGEIYGELNDSKNEVYYYELSNKIESNNYYTLKALLNAYVSAKNEKRGETLKHFHALDPGNPTIYNDLLSIYRSTPAELTAFYESQLSLFAQDKKAHGSLNFYLAQLYLPDNKQKAKECLIKAKNDLSAVLPKDNAVFKAIDTLMENTK